MTLGKLISEAATALKYSTHDLSNETGITPTSIKMLVEDELYTNTIPVRKLKELLEYLSIPLDEIEIPIMETFELMEDKVKNGKHKRTHFSILWENEESMQKYINMLKIISAK